VSIAAGHGISPRTKATARRVSIERGASVSTSAMRVTPRGWNGHPESSRSVRSAAASESTAVTSSSPRARSVETTAGHWPPMPRARSAP
jgi:hypothetical protein